MIEWFMWAFDLIELNGDDPRRDRPNRLNTPALQL
jgi:hypothetical protein